MPKSLTDKLIKNRSVSWLYKKASNNVICSCLLNTDLLHNKVFLYIVFAVSLVNLLLWIVDGDIINVIIFLLVGFLTAFFSKNMIIILLFSLVVSNIIKFGIHVGKEGFSEGADGDDDNGKEGADGGDVDDNGKEGADGDDDDGKEGADGGDVDDNGKEGADGDDDDGKEGMQTFGYSFIAEDNISSSISTMLDQQNKLLSNISTMSPYVINADNEAKLRSQMKYSEYVKQ